MATLARSRNQPWYHTQPTDRCSAWVGWAVEEQAAGEAEEGWSPKVEEVEHGPLWRRIQRNAPRPIPQGHYSMTSCKREYEYTFEKEI